MGKQVPSFGTPGRDSSAFLISDLHDREKPEDAMEGKGNLYVGCTAVFAFCSGCLFSGNRTVLCPTRVAGLDLSIESEIEGSG